MTIRRIYLLIFLLGFTGLLYSQDQVIDTITVSANRIPQKWHETGRDLVILDREAIRSIPAQSVVELLRYLPGLELQSRGAFGVQSDLSIRGATFSQVLVLIDGHRLNDPLTGHFNGYIPLAREEIARIEVLKGPAAAMYGADAMGGVINIITYPGNSDFQEEGLGGSASLQAGDHSLIKAENGVLFGSENMKAAVGLRMNESKGHPLNTGGRGFFDMRTASGGLALKKGPWRVYGRAGYDHRHFSAKNFYTLSPIDTSIETIDTWWSLLRASRIHKNGRTDVSLNYRNTQDVFDFNPAIPANEHNTKQWIVQLNHKRIIDDQLTLQAGLQATRRTIESTDRGDHETNHLGVYAMSLWKPINRLSMNASLRLDTDENYGVEVSPQFSAAYTWDRIVLRASIGRSIRAADFTERYISTEIPAPLSSGRNLGNPELNAERAWSAEIGGEWYPFSSPSFSVSASGFYRDAEDVIDYVLTPASEIETADNLSSNGEYLYAGNIAEVRVSGIDMQMKYKRYFGKKSLQFQAGLLLQEIDPSKTVISKYITNQAAALMNAHASWNTANFTFGISGLYKKRPSGSAEQLGLDLSDDYTVWNVDASVNVFENRVHATASVVNVFDKQYADILGAQMPGRWIMAGLRLEL